MIWYQYNLTIFQFKLIYYDYRKLSSLRSPNRALPNHNPRRNNYMKNSTLTKKNLTLKPKPKSGAILVKDEVADAEDNKINGNIEKIIEI